MRYTERYRTWPGVRYVIHASVEGDVVGFICDARVCADRRAPSIPWAWEEVGKIDAEHEAVCSTVDAMGDD